MKMTLGRKIVLGFIACAFVLIGVAIFSFKNSEKFVVSNALVNNSNKVLYEFEQILMTSVDAETGVRGYVITGDDNFLKPFTTANTKAIEKLEKVKELTKDNPNQQNNIEELAKEIKMRFDNLNTCVNLRKKDFEKARVFVASGEGKEIQDEIRKIIDKAQELERTLLTQRIQDSADDAIKFNIVFAILLLVIVLILIVVYSIVAENLKALKSSESENANKNWLLTGNSQLNEKLIGDQSIAQLANSTISFLCTYLKANIGAVYLLNDKENNLILNGKFAFSTAKDTKENFKLNEGLIGQAAWEQKQISLTDITENQIRITSSVLHAKPKNLLITPFLLEGKTIGVIEIGKLTDFNETEKEFINVSMNSIAISVNTVQQAEEKEKRAAELAIANKELAYQNDEKEKRAAELAIANKELAYQNDEKEKRAAELGIANKELAYQNDEKEKRAAELGIANKELAYQNDEKEKRAAELGIANKELAYQNEEKEKRASELGIANKELAYQNDEKEKRAVELSFANKELSNQAEELQIQQEELRQLNEELEQQAQNLKQQQEELQMTNEELEEQTQSLEEKNKEVEASKYNIEQKTKQLEISSKYKSEFLANMSHELRTPLNSLLILSKDLSENRKKNLDDVQVESAEIIYKSGHDLLVLINEVLDLSKIEAGKMAINIEKVALKNFTDNLLRDFKHQAEQKGLTILCKLAAGLPEFIHTDSQRLNQILKNLLSNAIKFTEKGSVIISIDQNTDTTLNISVRDTGIGISEDKQTAIFEAFQQAEGGTSRKYGGTGLGLSISRELAKLLEGEIKVKSNLDKGSTFSLIIPLEIHPTLESVNEIPLRPIAYVPRSENDINYLNYPTIKDDRDTINTDDKIVLIIEDDQNFAAILLKQANKKGFKCLSAASGEDGLLLAAKYRPQAIILDMGLPGIKGKQVLHELKVNPSVRHIPVHIISANDRSLEPIREGAVEYLMKPISKDGLEEAFNRIENFVNRKIKNLLIIEDSENSRKAMKVLIGNGDVKCYEAATGKEALELFEQNHIDCIILDIGLPDMTGFELIQKLGDVKAHYLPPIIVYTGKELTKEENNLLHKYAESIIIKGIKSEERLLDETALFLHRTISNLPKSKQMMIHNLHDKEAIFHSKKILLVDDDMRNVFALSKILQERGMEVIKSEDGKNALNKLEEHTDIDLVLMDIMMPEMDGYEAMKRIRSQIKFRNLPIIALTAKAMKDDKQKCIDAGANDYITKPIDVERLLSLMRVWLSK
ncbi:response regulator [Flavobacterium sp. LB2P84]|uniref:response regulator n=1 Tax=Flavobacterium yafengii TaxID=3041253 RepID=UPI0024AA00D4|nr:response regulator [Flavobacterium yafengii]MDI6033476.1 response regulator [Flavobacterium yafengii]